MTKRISFDKSVRDFSAGHNSLLKEVNGVNGSPKSLAPGLPDLDDQFNQMGITYIRLHDAYGIADIDNSHRPNRNNNQDQFILNVPDDRKEVAKTLIAELAAKRTLFPNATAGMNANSLDLAMSSPNYAITDSYLREIMNNKPELNPGNINREIMIRLGRSLDGGYELPSNFDIYAALCGEMFKRYSRDYTSIGLPRKVKYWEVWNEPDLTFFWNSNNPQQYYQFYEKIARIAKSIDPDIRIGGAGIANGYNPGGAYSDGFLRYCQTSNVPLDFYSWHYYGNTTSDPQCIIDAGDQVQKSLNQYGFGNVESICSEWNISPFSTKNVHNKSQSAKNAAFISSYFMYMQYTKVDKSNYYRGDGATFGLFNDQNNPSAPGSKNFCTYAGQSFNLFSRMFETPYMLKGSKDFSTGLTVIAGENESRNKVNILAANYKIDTNFPKGETAPTESPMYQQYHLDTNRTMSQLNDEWSKNEWFGGVDPNTLTARNDVTQNKTVTQLPVYGNLRAKPRTYTESDQGLTVTIQNIGYKNATVTAYRIKEWGSLASITPPDVSSQIQVSISNNVLTLTDTRATPSTVTFYSLDLNDEDSGGNVPVPNVLEYSLTFDFRSLPNRNFTASFAAILPDNYLFEAGKQYRLELSYPSSVTIKTCNTGSFVNGVCSSNTQKEYTYVNEIFTPMQNFTSGRLVPGQITAQYNGKLLVGNKNLAFAPSSSGVIRGKVTPL